MPPALTLAPHRALFTTGALATLLPMLWWLLELLGRASIASAGSPRAGHAGARPMDAVRGFSAVHGRLHFYRWPALAGREWPWRTRLCPLAAAWLLGHLAALAGLVYNWLWLYQSGQGLLPPACWDCAGYGWA